MSYNYQDSPKDSIENVTSNYYPINSAITMNDIHSNRTFTVMNGRAQAGSALTTGGIQFMQHRRIPADDYRGMGEPLEEVDALGNGIRVPATYYVQLFDRSNRQSAQRHIQLKTESPIQ